MVKQSKGYQDWTGCDRQAAHHGDILNNVSSRRPDPTDAVVIDSDLTGPGIPTCTAVLICSNPTCGLLRIVGSITPFAGASKVGTVGLTRDFFSMLKSHADITDRNRNRRRVLSAKD